MRKKEKAQLIQETLEKLFPDPAIPLNHQDPYTLLIAVLLSAQCQDSRVNEVTKNLFKKAQTPQQIIQLSIKEIEELIKSCGLFVTKAKNIWHLSKKLLEEHHGEVPSTLEELEALPGVGHKTASVVLVQAFKTPSFPVDTHIHRLAKRWGLTKGKDVKETEEDLKKLFPKTSWAKLHLQMIYYGRAYCPARGHKNETCPICLALEKPAKHALKSGK